jgi:hypothetical protein
MRISIELNPTLTLLLVHWRCRSTFLAWIQNGISEVLETSVLSGSGMLHDCEAHVQPSFRESGIDQG